MPDSQRATPRYETLVVLGLFAAACQAGLVYFGATAVGLVVGWVGAGVAYCGGWRGLTGLGRRVVLAASLLWVVGSIVLIPTVPATDHRRLYLVAIAIGCLLFCAALGQQLQAESEYGRTGWLLFSAGLAFVAPATVGVLGGAEIVTLGFVLSCGVTVILLYLFRPVG